MPEAFRGQEFAFYPNRYAHESWRADLLAPPLWDLLEKCPRTEGRLATFVGEAAGLGVPVSLGFDTPQARFCLLPWSAVANIARRLGLVLNAQRFSKVIDGKLVARIKRDLGADAYGFALRRAPLITTQSDPLVPDLASEAQPLEQVLERSGVNYIGIALNGVPDDLKARFRLKLPKPHAALLDKPTGNVTPLIAWAIVRKVVREAEPEWTASLE